MEHLLTQSTAYSRKGNDSNRTIVYTPPMHKGTIDNRESADKIMALVMDLVDNPDYLPFFYKRLYAIGPDRFLQSADLARKVGFKKGRKFTQLIK